MNTARRSLIALSDDASVHDKQSLGRLRHILRDEALRGWSMALTPPPQSAVTEWLNPTELTLGDTSPRVALGLSAQTTDDALRDLRDQFCCSWLWEVETHVQMGTARDGGDRGGIYRLGLIRRLTSLDRDTFRRHYLQTHAPLVVQQNPLFDRYVVHIANSGPSGWDAINEQRFDSAQRWAEHDALILATRPAVRADLRRFVGGMIQFAGRDRVEFGD